MAANSSMLNCHLDAPTMVEFDSKRGSTRVMVRFSAKNVSESEDYVLHSAASTRRPFWHVLDEDHREIQREPRPTTGTASNARIRTETVAAGHGVHESVRVSLDNGALESGKTYTVRVAVFGQTAETTFVAIEKPARARAAGKRKPKKATRKKAARKKPAKRKATKKRPAKRKAAKKKPAKGKATKKRPAKRKAAKKRPAKRKATKKRRTKKRGK